MYQWRLMKDEQEINYGRKMAKEMNLLFIKDINLDNLDIGHPINHLSSEDALHITFDMELDNAILALKHDNNKSFFEFNGLMYCKLYPRYKGSQDMIIVMDLYYANIMK